MASLLFFMWYLLENYDSNPQIKQLVDHTEIIIIPVVNPDGLDLNLRGNRKTSTASVDLNRNFAYAWSSSCTGCNPGTAAFSETESQFVRDMYNAFNFGAVESLHSYYEGILHPFSCDPSLNPAQCSDLSGTPLTNYQQLTGFQRSRNYYRSGSFFQLLGYAGSGCSIDWMYKGNTLSGSNKANYQTYATLTEVGTGHWYSNINDMIRVCKENMHNLLSTVRLAGTYAELQETTSSILTQTSGNLSVQFKRYGLKDGNFEISCEAITPNISFDAPITVSNPAAFSSQTISIPYTLNSFSAGYEILFKLMLNNGNYTIVDTIRKVYNGSNLYVSGLGNLSDGTTVLTSSIFGLTNGDKAMLTFQSSWNLKRQYSSSTPAYSSVKLEISSNGTTWFPLKGKFSGDYNETILQSYTGLQSDIVREYIDLSDYVGQSNLRIRATLSKYSTGNTFSMTNIEIINPESVPICTTPTISNPSTTFRVNAGSLSISATPSAGAIKWYDAAENGTEITHDGTNYSISGNQLTIHNLTSTTTYYAEAADGSCVSATRTPVVARIYIPGLKTCGQTLAQLNAPVRFTYIPNTKVYRYEITGPGVNQVLDRYYDSTITLSSISGIQYSSTYSIRVRRLSMTNEWSSWGPTCSVNTPAEPKLSAANCGSTIYMANQILNLVELPLASVYRIKLQKVGSPTFQTIDRYQNNERFNLNMFSGLEASTNYEISVAAWFGGTTPLSPYGSICTITTPGTIGLAQDNTMESVFVEEQTLTVFPNPNNGTFTASASQPGDFVLLNSLGQIIQHISLTEENLKIEITNLSSGMYFLSGTLDGQPLIEKIVVE